MEMEEVESELGMLEEIELNGPENETEKNGPMKDFNEILESVGGSGKYQKFILYVILGSFMLLIPLFALNKIFMLSIPSHNCHVDGRPHDIDLDTWKNMTLPKEIGPDGHERFSQCQMLTPDGGSVVCSQWDYDQSEYESTIPTEFNWVCNKSHYATNVFTVAFSGNVFGSVIFGRAADRWGRKPILFLTVGMYISLEIICLFIPQFYVPFLILHFISESAFPFLFMTPMLLVAEISGKDYRGWIYSVAWMIFVGGDVTLPIVAWLLRSWFSIGLVTTLPGALLLLYYKKLPESPRWLLGMGRIDEAEEIIKEIARVNGRPIDEKELHRNLLEILEKGRDELGTGSVVKGALTIFTKKRLARNTILLCVTMSMNRIIFDGLVLNATNMSGNEFLNFIILGLIELPSGLLAGVLVERMGRRWTLVGFYFLSSISFLVISIAVFHSNLSWMVLLTVVTAKFGVSISTLVVYLQATELYPTSLRSTGNGVMNFVSSIMGISAPYIVFLGTFNVVAPYILLGILCLLGSVTGAYLPETLNSNLPSSIEEADQFGKNQKFWSFLPNEQSRKGKDEKRLDKIN